MAVGPTKVHGSSFIIYLLLQFSVLFLSVDCRGWFGQRLCSGLLDGNCNHFLSRNWFRNRFQGPERFTGKDVLTAVTMGKYKIKIELRDIN